MATKNTAAKAASEMPSPTLSGQPVGVDDEDAKPADASAKPADVSAKPAASEAAPAPEIVYVTSQQQPTLEELNAVSVTASIAADRLKDAAFDAAQKAVAQAFGKGTIA